MPLFRRNDLKIGALIYQTFMLALVLALVPISPVYADGRLIASGGASSVEGTAGGGIVPWAVLSGYATADETGATGFFTHANTDDFTFNALGAAYTFHNRLELSYARQEFDRGSGAALAGVAGDTLRQDVYGVKVRLAGDVIFTRIPQIAAGIQYKDNRDFDFAESLGAKDDTGIDYYLSATKLFLGGIAGRNLLLNGTLRATRANQIGILGFGGDENNGYEFMPELSAGVLLDHQTIIGVEYRSKPDNLSSRKEDDWYDFFFGYFPNKHLAIVAAYTDMGEVDGIDRQRGLALNLQAAF